MPRQKPADKLEALRLKREQINAQLKALEARNRENERKADTRRKVIAGALALEHAAKNPGDNFSKKLVKLLNEYVTRPSDRALFGLLLDGSEGADANGQSEAAE